MPRKKKELLIETDEQKKDIYNKFVSVNSMNQAHKLFGISDNSSGAKYLREIAKNVGFDINIYKECKNKRLLYCLNCGKPLVKGQYKFCCRSCSASYTNVGKTHTVSQEAREAISKKLKEYNKQNPRPCNEATNKRKERQELKNNGLIQTRQKKLYTKNCAMCGIEYTTKYVNSKFCSNKCHVEYKHKEKYNDFLENNEKYCRGNYMPKSFKKEFLDEQGGVCAICGCKPEHNGKPLVFILDHIDGNAANNKRENLRLICPNCDSQLPTFKSKNKHSARRHYNSVKNKQ